MPPFTRVGAEADFRVWDPSDGSNIYTEYVSWANGNVTFKGTDKAGEEFSVVELYRTVNFPRCMSFGSILLVACMVYSAQVAFQYSLLRF